MTHRIPSRTTRRAATVALTAALLAPAGAAAHTSVYTSPTKTYDGTQLVDGPVHYLVANHGHNVVLRESNGRTTGGALNYKVLPSAWRSGQTKGALLETATGAQPHATCEGLTALDQAAVLGWQEADPFYAYVPWQSTAAGLGDEEEVGRWIGVVRSATGVDLTGLSAEQAQAACTGKGGTYVPADAIQTTGAALSAGDIALVADPLKAQIETYKAQLAAADTSGGAAAAKAQADAKAARDAAGAAEAAKNEALARAAKAEAALKTATTPLAIRVVSGAFTGKGAAKGVVAELSGPANAAVIVVATPAPAGKGKRATLPEVVATAEAKLDAAGKATVTVKPTKAAAKALATAKGSPSIALGLTAAETAVATVKAGGTAKAGTKKAGK